MIRSALLVSGLVLAACEGATEASMADRKAAEARLVQIIETAYPNYSGTAQGARCIARYATDGEILILAGQKQAVSSRSLTALGTAIAQRPETQSCFNSNNIPPLG